MVPRLYLLTPPFTVTPEIRLLRKSVRTHWRIIALTVIASLAAAVAEVFSVGMLIPFLQTFSEGTSDPFRSGITWIDQYLLAVDGTPLERTYHTCGLILVGTWMRALLGYTSGVLSVKSRVEIVEDLRRQIVDQLQSVSLSFFSKTKGGDLLNSITTEISRATTAVSVVFNIIIQGTVFIMYFSLMTWISGELTLLVLGVFGALSFGLTWLMRTIRSHGEWLTEANRRFSTRFTEFIGGIRTVVAYNRQPHERKRLFDRIEDLANATVSTFKRSSLVQPLSHTIVGTVLVILIVVAIQFYVIPGKLDIAFLLGFLFALFRLMPTVNNLNDQRGVWASNSPGLANVAALLDPADKPYQAEGTLPAPSVRKGIRFESVDFAYEPGEPVLHDIDLSIPSGSMVALVGGSGAGKSTLADLIPRFYDPTSGRILLDDTDLRDLDLRSLRDRIAVVSQSSHMFNDTVWANIGYGNLSADRATIRQAAAEANALDFIEEMDDGFDTLLGERGVRVSGGQRQRLAIARALLKDPEILILDEATSHLDSKSEQLVQSSIERLMEGRTVLAIAHRLSTIENADWVVVLEDGCIVEQGPYEDLLRRKNAFWSYHQMQTQGALAS